MISHKQNFVCWPSVGPQDIKHTTYTNMCKQICKEDEVSSIDYNQLLCEVLPLSGTYSGQ